MECNYQANFQLSPFISLPNYDGRNFYVLYFNLLSLSGESNVKTKIT